MRFVILTLLNVGLITSVASAECKKHIELLSAAEVAKEYGKSEIWVLQNHKINLWAKPSPDKFPQVGKMLPGSRALLLEEGENDYKVRSPLDQSEGWVSKIQVKRTLMQDTETRKACG